MLDHTTLGYLCEARPIFTVGEKDPDQLCHFPFKHDGVTYTSCSHLIVDGINPKNETWCATEVNKETFKTKHSVLN